MPNLIETLSSFNRKERFYLIGKALGNSTFVLSDAFRRDLAHALDPELPPIPKDAFAAMDYHLDWIYASLYIARNALPAPCTANATGKIRGTPEDVDLLVAFEDRGQRHLVLIEAKGATGFTNKQFKSKATRLEEIFGKHGNCWPGVTPHFAVISPRKPQRLETASWPQWMTREGRIPHLRLDMPNNLMKVTRCDEQARSSSIGGYWKVERG